VALLKEELTMPTFLFSYRMPVNYQPGRPDAIASWIAYFQGMGDHVVDRGQPVSETAELGHCGAGTRPGLSQRIGLLRLSAP
jgi:hypothetical protein